MRKKKWCKPHFLMQIHLIFCLEGHYFLDIQYKFLKGRADRNITFSTTLGLIPEICGVERGEEGGGGGRGGRSDRTLYITNH